MLLRSRFYLFFLWGWSLLIAAGVGQESVRLPDGVWANWDLGQAHRESTATRERISINGLWRWQPARSDESTVPAGRWGWFKVPGEWPGITDYMQKDTLSVFAHDGWRSVLMKDVTAAWYQRDICIPQSWANSPVKLHMNWVNSVAAVWIDHEKVGEVLFPGGELDLSSFCRPGETQQLSILVAALPLQGVMLSYTDSAAAREVKGTVNRRGLCGDVSLVREPSSTRIASVRIDTSVRRKKLTITADLARLNPMKAYYLGGTISQRGKTVRQVRSPAFTERDLIDGSYELKFDWLPETLWDVHLPDHTFQLDLSLREIEGSLVDTYWSERFGFRELWIDGRDFFLNGTRIFLSAVPLDNAQVSAFHASYQGAVESLQRLKKIGVNFVYTHHYHCQPGAHLALDEILRAADDVGMLVALSQPHFSHYDWQASNASRTNGYARHAKYYAEVAGNHPSVVFYSMSHNATGYSEDMNPWLMDGATDPRVGNATRNRDRAIQAEAIVRELDTRRIVYHHAGGNIGAMHTVNFYPNFVPIQEMSDWFGYWSRVGRKPVFTCEYGAPFPWDWTMYRGWYRGEREFGSAKVPWDYSIAEWNAQFYGDQAYEISERTTAERENIRWEAKQFARGEGWNRWSYPHPVGSDDLLETHPITASYLIDNWRSFRSWGVSGISAWLHGSFFVPREDVDRQRRELPTDWEALQRPGFQPDFIDKQYERHDLAFDEDDWIPTPAGEALLRNNRPLLGWIGGKPSSFTSKDHLFTAGESFEKQLMVINNSRQTVSCDCDWTIGLPYPIKGTATRRIATGEQERILISPKIPSTTPLGTYRIQAQFRFSTGEVQSDEFFFSVVSAPTQRSSMVRIAVWDPLGDTIAALKQKSIQHEIINASEDLSGFEILIIGRRGLTVDGAAPDLRAVRTGLRVILFEQSPEVLEQRFGFRTAVYGMRQIFARVPDHPLLNRIETSMLQDWRGAATLLPDRLAYQSEPRLGPTVSWCGFTVPRLWRCGNQGNVASALIEKPTRGDFLPIVDSGYSLQYSPLLEYQEEQGLILFCQLDVTARTEQEPTAALFFANLIERAIQWSPPQRRRAVYLGREEGRRFIESLGYSIERYRGEPLDDEDLLILGPEAAAATTHHRMLRRWIDEGGRVLALGLDQSNADAFFSFSVRFREAEHISTHFNAAAHQTFLSGISPAEVHNRDPRNLLLVVGGAEAIGDGVVAVSPNRNVVFCQLLPWEFLQLDRPHIRRTFRRASLLVSRLLTNGGIEFRTPLIERFITPPESGEEKRWSSGFYLDQPEEWDDPYRFFRW